MIYNMIKLYLHVAVPGKLASDPQTVNASSDI